MLVLLAVIGLVACGGDDDGDGGETGSGDTVESPDGESTDDSGDGDDAEGAPGLPSCDLFSIEDAEALLGIELEDNNSGSSTPTDITCYYNAAGDEHGRVVWSVILNDVDMYWQNGELVQGIEPLEGLGDEARVTPDSIQTRVGDEALVNVSVLRPGVEPPDNLDVDASKELAQTILDAL